MMLLAFRVLFLLGLAMPLHGTRRDQAVPVKLEQRTRQRERTVRLILDTKMQPPITSMFGSPIANKSLSPWTYRESYVESRFPKQIFHACCLTSGCLNLQGGGEDMTLEARPIYYQVLVLHRVPRKRKKAAGKKYAFRLGTEIITVGCTCVRPNTIQL